MLGSAMQWSIVQYCAKQWMNRNNSSVLSFVEWFVSCSHLTVSNSMHSLAYKFAYMRLHHKWKHIHMFTLNHFTVECTREIRWMCVCLCRQVHFKCTMDMKESLFISQKSSISSDNISNGINNEWTNIHPHTHTLTYSFEPILSVTLFLCFKLKLSVDDFHGFCNHCKYEFLSFNLFQCVYVCVCVCCDAFMQMC